MATKPDPHPPDPSIVPVKDSISAPFIFYEVAPVFGFTNGVINLTLSANRSWVTADGVQNEQVVVAHLRGNIQAAMSLRKAIEDALLLAAPTANGQAN
jgi:hypothetical protein